VDAEAALLRSRKKRGSGRTEKDHDSEFSLNRVNLGAVDPPDSKSSPRYVICHICLFFFGCSDHDAGFLRTFVNRPPYGSLAPVRQAGKSSEIG
jgi:hypothetical protein